MNNLVLIRGGGDIATGIAHRLYQSRFNVVILEIPKPTVVRRTVAFAQAVIQGQPMTVEGVTARLTLLDEAKEVLLNKQIPVLLAPELSTVRHVITTLKPLAIVDAIIAKHNLGTNITDAPVVIGVGPGFAAGIDVDAVVETMRGHDLGRVIYQGKAIDNTGVPGEIAGYTLERLIKAPVAGRFISCRQIGEKLAAGEIVAHVDDTPVLVEIEGVLRGLLQNDISVKQGMKLGDVDPRCRREHCFSISDKARAIGGGVLEALLHLGGKHE